MHCRGTGGWHGLAVAVLAAGVSGTDRRAAAPGRTPRPSDARATALQMVPAAELPNRSQKPPQSYVARIYLHLSLTFHPIPKKI